jgi:uncharacterized protein (DUF1499 family)
MRSLPVEPVPRLATASRWLVATAWVLAIVSAASARFGGVPPLNALFVLGVSILLAVLAIVASIMAMAGIWRSGAPGTGLAARSLFFAAVLLVWPGYLAITALRLPVLNDVTTNVDDAPSFARSRVAVDARKGVIPAEFDPRKGPAVQEAYADLAPILLERSPEEVMALVRRVATGLGWTIIDSVNPAGRTGAGRLDAVASSFLFRFPDDITIRIRPGAGDVRIDMRSASRFGRHDFGSNAAHIRAFAREIETLSAGR